MGRDNCEEDVKEQHGYNAKSAPLPLLVEALI